MHFMHLLKKWPNMHLHMCICKWLTIQSLVINYSVETSKPLFQQIIILGHLGNPPASTNGNQTTINRALLLVISNIFYFETYHKPHLLNAKT
jgi:hypothetical protein